MNETIVDLMYILYFVLLSLRTAHIEHRYMSHEMSREM